VGSPPRATHRRQLFTAAEVTFPVRGDEEDEKPASPGRRAGVEDSGSSRAQGNQSRCHRSRACSAAADLPADTIISAQTRRRLPTGTKKAPCPRRFPSPFIDNFPPSFSLALGPVIPRPSQRLGARDDGAESKGVRGYLPRRGPIPKNPPDALG